MERNWLIRTSQNQILGPVAKQKLLEFIQKGALGLTDEVTSGNGYWFQLREKELVEKYLYGDLPQGYNPISESKSVLAKREKPEVTSSINLSPANKTQSLKVDSANVVTPKSEDLEFPDVTLVGKMPDLKSLKSSSSTKNKELKLPSSDDLEFPDVSMIKSTVSSSSVSLSGQATVEATQFINVKALDVKPVKPASPAPAQTKNIIDDEIHYPKDDDLEFPDVESIKENTQLTSPKIEKGKVDLNQQYTRTVALDNHQKETDLPKVLSSKVEDKPQNDDNEDWEFDVKIDQETSPKPKVESSISTAVTEIDMSTIAPVIENESIKSKKPASRSGFNEKAAVTEEKKLLFERKVKNNKSPASLRDPEREMLAKKTQHVGEPLKKRNDNYLFFILVIVVLIIIAVFFYFKEILNKPLPV